MSANGVTPFFDNAIKQKVMKRNEFAFYFNADDKAGNGIFWGGVDPSFYEGEIKMFPVSIPYYWAVDLHKFMIGDTEIHVGNVIEDVGSKALKLLQSKRNPFRQVLQDVNLPEVKKPQLIVDSGTTYFTAESGVYERIMALIPARACDKVTSSSHPPLKYFLKDASGQIHEFKIPNDEYMVSDGDGSHCEPAFMKIDIPKKYGPGMLLGEVFMRNYFTVFQRGDGSTSAAQVGFARSKKGLQTNAALKKLTAGQESFKQAHHGSVFAEMVEAEKSKVTRFHHKPGTNEGSSEIQLKSKSKNLLK